MKSLLFPPALCAIALFLSAHPTKTTAQASEKWEVGMSLAGILWVDDGQRNDTDYALGLGGGYWIPLLDRHAALAFDLRARHWYESGEKEFVFGIRLSLLFGERSS